MQYSLQIDRVCNAWAFGLFLCFSIQKRQTFSTTQMVKYMGLSFFSKEAPTQRSAGPDHLNQVATKTNVAFSFLHAFTPMQRAMALLSSLQVGKRIYTNSPSLRKNLMVSGYKLR